MSAPIVLEVCVDSVASAIASQRGGAQRVELCVDLAEGGLTPSAGMIAMVRSRLTIPLHVLIRPRAGDFCYTDEEFEIMRKDVALAKQLGANGVVFGMLGPEGHVDGAKLREVVTLASPLSVTFHRAFDLTPDFGESLEAIVASGAHRVLTSGGEPTAERGLEKIRSVVAAASGRVVVMACGSIREHNIGKILGQTGVREVHANLQSVVPGIPGRPKRADGEVATWSGHHPKAQVRAETVARFLAAASAAEAGSGVVTP